MTVNQSQSSAPIVNNFNFGQGYNELSPNPLQQTGSPFQFNFYNSGENISKERFARSREKTVRIKKKLPTSQFFSRGEPRTKAKKG